MIKIFFGGFPLDADELQIAQMIGPYGDIETIKIVRDRVTKNCKGYAFIEMADLAGAERAVAALNGTEMAGRELKLSICTETVPKPAASYVKVARPQPGTKPKRRRL